MKRKLVIIFLVLVFGVLAVLLGGLFKIQHWSGGDALLLAGFGALLAALIGLVTALIQRYLLRR